MKKLALALLCLVSVAFFASCDPKVENPEPAITVATNDGYLADGDVVEVGENYVFGFNVASNAETAEELTSLVITVDDAPFETVELSGDAYNYSGEISWSVDRQIIGQSVIKAVVTDADNKTNTATITVDVNFEEPLVETPFEWFRQGNTQTGLAEFGLKWEANLKEETHAQIKPLDGVKMYILTTNDWTNTNNVKEKNILFNQLVEGGTPVASVYNNVSTSVGGTYDDVIGTVMPNGELHLINVTKCVIGEFAPTGYPITISGNAK